MIHDNAKVAVSFEEFFNWWDIHADAVIEQASQKGGWRQSLLGWMLGARSGLVRVRRIGKAVRDHLEAHLKVLDIPGLVYDDSARRNNDKSRNGTHGDTTKLASLDNLTFNVNLSVGSTEQRNLLEPKEERMSVEISLKMVTEEEALAALQMRGGGGELL